MPGAAAAPRREPIHSRAGHGRTAPSAARCAAEYHRAGAARPAFFACPAVFWPAALFSRQPSDRLISGTRSVRHKDKPTQEETMRRVLASGVAGMAALAIAFSAAPSSAQDKLTVWWVKGFYKSEDDALYAAIKKYEAKSGVKVDLSQYAVQDMITKTVAALDAGTPPDVAYADVYDFQVLGKWAYDGKLEDISDVITPIKDRFAPNTIETTYLYNDKTKKKAYYGFPLKQQTMHIEYWIDMLEK